MSRGKGKLRRALITSHAVERFMERWRPLDVHDEAPKTMDEWFEKCRTILIQSNEVNQDGVSRVLQLINHGQVARYFVNKGYGLKFVVMECDGDSLAVKTVILIGQNYKLEDSST